MKSRLIVVRYFHRAMFDFDEQVTEARYNCIRVSETNSIGAS